MRYFLYAVPIAATRSVLADRLAWKLGKIYVGRSGALLRRYAEAMLNSSVPRFHYGNSILRPRR